MPRAKRSQCFFAGQGLRVLRFWNNEIDGNLGVLTLIDDALHNPHPTSLRSEPPSPFGGRIGLTPRFQPARRSAERARAVAFAAIAGVGRGPGRKR